MEGILFKGTWARALALSMTLALPGFALAQEATAARTKVAGPREGFRARLQAAASLYEELEYEQALEALSQARQLALTDDERVQVALYEGIVLADLGQRPRSLTAFREALSLKLDARLPVKVSPKVERDFETVRREVRNEREALAGVKSPPPPAPTEAPPATDRPVQPPETPTVVATPTSVPPASSPELDLGPSPAGVERARGLRPLPLALLGAGVVAGGVGSYFGLQSQGNIDDARESILTETRSSHLETARGQALAANILFGVALTAAAGAAITWLTGNDTGRTAEVSP